MWVWERTAAIAYPEESDSMRVGSVALKCRRHGVEVKAFLRALKAADASGGKVNGDLEASLVVRAVRGAVRAE